MFLLIWRGLGILVPVFVVIAFFLSAAISGLLEGTGLPASLRTAISLALMGLLAGSALFVVAAKVESKPARILVDPATNQQIKFRSSAGSFFFVPTRYWAWIVGLVGLIGAGAVAIGVNL